MTDRELLELAAKAAGIRLEWDGPPDQWTPVYYQGKTYHSFEPITADAARACHIPNDEPDLRILHGAARALAELAANAGDRHQHRQSITSGLAAAERLLPRCSVWAIGTAALKLDQLLAGPDGLTVYHITQPAEAA